MDRLFTTLGRAREHVRCLAARSLRLGRRSMALGVVLLAASAVTVWATTNNPPRITSLTVTPNTSVINEGQTLTISGTFTDPDVTDLHTIMVYWKDNPTTSTRAEKLQLAAGQTTFQLSHVFTNDLPPTNIKVDVADRQLPVGSNDNTDGLQSRDVRLVPIQVNNVAPNIVDPSVHLTKTPLDETVLVTIDGDWTDPGADTGIVSFVSSDSSRITYCSRANRHFHCEHEYHLPEPLRSKVYPITVKVADGDGGLDTWTSSVRIP